MPYKDKEVGKAHMRAYFESHPEIREHNKERMKEWYHKHYDETKEQRAKEYREMSVQQKSEKQDKALERNRQIRLEVLKHYGNGQVVCIQCGEKRTGCLSIDHINGNGNAHRRTLGSVNIFRWLRRNNYPLGFRTLCMNCQFCNRPRRIFNEPIIAVNVR